MANNRGRTWVAGNLVMLLMVLALVSCRPVRDYFDATRSEPNKADLVGLWVPDHSSLEYIRNKGHYDPNVKTRLILKPDGTFELTNMPDCWNNGFGEAHGAFESYSGKWDVSHEVSSFWELTLNSQKSGRNVGLFGRKAPYRLNFVIGDPDSDESVVFIKQ